MEDKNRRGKGHNGRVIVYAIMAGFCILALIEIIYGHLQTQAQYDQKAMQKNNDLQKEGYLQSNNEESGNTDIPDIPLQGMKEDINDDEHDSNGDTGEEENNTANDHDMQIVFLGDSILDHVREYDGVAYLISQACNADVYNMSIGGTTAALMAGEQFDYNNWTSCSLLGVVHAILGDIDGEIFNQYRAGDILKECDFSQTDYFFIEYGLNDFLARIPNTKYREEGEELDIDTMHTYVGALEAAIGSLHNAFPAAKIIVASPHYCQFFNGDTYIGDSYSLDYGYGPMIDYSKLCSYVYNNNKDKNVIFFDTIMDSGIDAYSADDYLEDGIHLTAAGRHAYADSAARLINADFRKNE